MPWRCILCLINHHATQTYGGMDVSLHKFLTLALDKGEWSALCNCFTPWGKSPWYPLHRRLGGPQSQSGHSGRKKKSLHYYCWKSNPSCPAHSLATILPELHWLFTFPYFIIIQNNVFWAKGTWNTWPHKANCDFDLPQLIKHLQNTLIRLLTQHQKRDEFYFCFMQCQR
jgi:hypothetical protein